MVEEWNWERVGREGNSRSRGRRNCGQDVIWEKDRFSIKIKHDEGTEETYGKRTEKKYSKKVDVYFSLNILTIISEIYKKGNSKIKKLKLKNI